jgi:hypothetical protein
MISEWRPAKANASGGSVSVRTGARKSGRRCRRRPLAKAWWLYRRQRRAVQARSAVGRRRCCSSRSRSLWWPTRSPPSRTRSRRRCVRCMGISGCCRRRWDGDRDHRAGDVELTAACPLVPAGRRLAGGGGTRVRRGMDVVADRSSGRRLHADDRNLDRRCGQRDHRLRLGAGRRGDPDRTRPHGGGLLVLLEPAETDGVRMSRSAATAPWNTRGRRPESRTIWAAQPGGIRSGRRPPTDRGLSGASGRCSPAARALEHCRRSWGFDEHDDRGSLRRPDQTSRLTRRGLNGLQ